MLRYSKWSSLPIWLSICHSIQNASLCLSSFLYAAVFKMLLFASPAFYMPLYSKWLSLPIRCFIYRSIQHASFRQSGFLYATLFKILPFTNLIPIRFKKLHTTRTGRHSARLRPSAGLFSPFRPECTAEAQDTGWLCFYRRGALLRWRESALFFKSSLFERSEFGLLENGFSRFPAS